LRITVSPSCIDAPAGPQMRNVRPTRQPKTNAGSLTFSFDMVAELTEDHKFLTVAVVNATESEQKSV
jgi:hypothetical protein